MWSLLIIFSADLLYKNYFLERKNQFTRFL
jgi:hypothetical protein